MKNLKKALSFVLLVVTMASAFTVNVSADTVCTSWSTYYTYKICDKSSGICAWNNWSPHSEFTTYYKRKSCTNEKGAQWWEYTTSVEKSCCS